LRVANRTPPGWPSCWPWWWSPTCRSDQGTPRAARSSMVSWAAGDCDIRPGLETNGSYVATLGTGGPGHQRTLPTGTKLAACREPWPVHRGHLGPGRRAVGHPGLTSARAASAASCAAVQRG
jgi:hypothetical protein